MFAAVFAACPAYAQDQAGPLSAIDWLKDPAQISVAQPLQTPLEAGLPPVAGVTGSTVPDVQVTSLEAPNRDAAGLLPSSTTGLPQTLWSASATDTVVALLARLPADPLPATQALYYTLLLAEAETPGDAGQNGRFLNARLDALRSFGAVDPAYALAEQAGPQNPNLFDAWFDLAMLSGKEDVSCQALENDPTLTERYDARIFCAARSGDWQTAALTYETATALGVLDGQTSSLLAQFLDPELIHDAPQLAPSPSRMTPLTFRLYEATGAPLPTSNLPREYAVADLRGVSGWKAELEAAERLVHTGALPANQLLGLYTNGKPSASGGVWERTAGIQKLERAIDANDVETVEQTLPNLWRDMRREGLAVAFATLFAEDLSKMELAPRAKATAFQIALLSPDYESLAPPLFNGSKDQDFLIGLAKGQPEAALAETAGRKAIVEAFSTKEASADHASLLSEGRLGQAILQAALQLDASGPNTPSDIRSALATLRAVGLEDTARRAALQILLLRGDG